MKTKRLIFLLALLLLLASSSLSYGGEPFNRLGGEFTLDWYTLDGGGIIGGSGGTYSLNGTLGQADAGQGSGGVFTLAGGFWHTVLPPTYDVYLPVARKQP